MRRWIALLCMIGLLFVVGCAKEKETSVESPVELTVFAASSLTDAFEELATGFEDQHQDVTVVFNFGASGALQTQIAQGAPCDVFASAGQKQMDGLVEDGLIQTDSERTFARNRLVVITSKETPLEIHALQDLLNPEIAQISIGDPATAPVGQYSVEVLTGQELLDQVQDKLVYGSNVRQVLQYVEQGEVELGFVYSTDAAMSEKVEICYTVPEEMHNPITYPVGIIQESAHSEMAEEFIAWIASEEGQQILEKYGFEPEQ